MCAGDVTQQQGGESLVRVLQRARAVWGLLQLCLSNLSLADMGSDSGVCKVGRLRRARVCLFRLHLKPLDCKNLSLHKHNLD